MTRHAPRPTVNIVFDEGDDERIAITKTDDNSDPEDITGWTFWFTVKESKADDDSEAVIQESVSTHLNPSAGETEILLPKSKTNDLTGTYYYDIQFKDDNGDISTALAGRVRFDHEVTQAT